MARWFPKTLFNTLSETCSDVAGIVKATGAVLNPLVCGRVLFLETTPSLSVQRPDILTITAEFSERPMSKWVDKLTYFR